MIEKGNFKFKAFKVGIEITYRCNLNCKFCYVSQEAKQEPDISIEKLFSLIDQIAETECFLLSLLGGEPFIRDNFLEIYKYIIKKGVFIHILTNGTIIRTSILDYLAKYPPKLITVAIYAGSEKGYERICGSKKAFKSVMEFAKILKNKNIQFRFSTLVNKLNVNEFGEIIGLAESFDVPLVYSMGIGPRFDKDNTPCQLRLSLVEREKVINMSKKRKAAERNLEEGGYCNGMLLIDNFGKLVPCIIDRNKYYDLNKISFKEALSRMKDIRIRCPCE